MHRHTHRHRETDRQTDRNWLNLTLHMRARAHTHTHIHARAHRHTHTGFFCLVLFVCLFVCLFGFFFFWGGGVVVIWFYFHSFLKQEAQMLKLPILAKFTGLLQSSPLHNQLSQTFELLHATLQQNNCTSSKVTLNEDQGHPNWYHNVCI